MAIRTEEYIADAGRMHYTVTWDKPEGYTDKVLKEILADCAPENEAGHEVWEATYKYLRHLLEADPAMIFQNRRFLEESASAYVEGYEDAMKAAGRNCAHY